MRKEVWQVTLQEGKWYVFCGSRREGPYTKDEAHVICMRRNRGEK